MSKLKIPAAELIGSPLTSNELKSIIAGYQNGGLKCLCSYDNKSTSSIQETMGACATWCSGKCHDEGKTSWTATYAGMTISGD